MIRLLAATFCMSFFSAALAAPVKSAADTNSNTSIEGYLQTLSTVPGFTNLRDPFLAVDPPYKSRLDQISGNAPETVGPLERYPITSYKLEAVLLNDERPRALVRVPGESEKGEKGDASGGKLLIVRLMDRIGNRGGVITRMDDGMVFVTETTYARRKNITESKVTVLKLSGKVDFK